ncbi:protein kinase [Microbulbifer sp. SH-1]|uniref:serine/threonine-protein kinase n=1 Tax=Microbulbifer sp. SH-1 TaxID=2681547 RepID=UPI00140D832B|nr:serine/threonine-protein kinase [Microbulbifer sp. SH-1]QIL90124.1 protein kinase [Microbulbifer sp. SH-1]
MDIADSEVGRHASAPNKLVVDSDRYVIHSTLGAGGMGIVYLAEDLKLHRQVAIKKLKDDAASQNARDRIQQEARLLAQLNHPNIVALYDVLEENGSVALVMEYIEGASLRAWMRERTPSLQQKLSLLMQISLGLQQAHDLDIIHRDLKPDNILITENAKGQPTAKITDFGIAKSQMLDEKTLTAENQLAGTVTAMSPEQILGKPLDARSDLFSLGTIAFELLCGSRPFDKHEAGALAMANRITNEPHLPPQQAWPSIPEPLAILLDKLLAKDPAQRPESALIVHQGFALLHKQGLDTETEDYTATLTDLFTRQQVKSRRRWQRVVAGIAAALVVGAGGYWGWKEITRLEPQYIAVMPVEINGEIHGEENAVALTRTMVRQALMNSVSQLKASALVSFEPKEGMDFEAQLQALRNKGVTDALFARLECAEVRCEIELQRLNPNNSQVQKQSGFAFLADKRQEAEHRITSGSIDLFAESYSKYIAAHETMTEQDYSDYLNILSRQESKDISADDVETLKKFIGSYPQNPNLYRAYTQVATDLFVLTDNKSHLQAGLDMLERAKTHDISASLILELELWLQTYNANKPTLDKLIEKINQQEAPSAELLAKLSRYLFTQGDYKSGLKYARKAAALNPSADNLYLVALNQISTGNYSDARITLHQLTSNAPEHWPSYSALGVIELESGNYSAAELAIGSIPEDSRSWRTKQNLGVIYFLQGKYPESLKISQQILSVTPENIPVTEQIAEIYLLTGDTEMAKVYFFRLLDLTKNKSGLLERQYHALALANTNQQDVAIPLAHELLKDASDDTYVKHTVAQIYALASEWRSANYYIEQLLTQGMSAEWFNLPGFQKLCTQPETSEKVKVAICN